MVKKGWWLALAASLVVAGAFEVPASSPESASPLEGWTRITLEGRKYLVARGRSSVTRWPPSGDELPGLVAVDSEASVLGAGVSTHHAFAESDAEGRPLRWLGWTPGKKARHAALEDGTLVVEKLVPGEKAPPDPQRGWTVAQRTELALSGEGEEAQDGDDAEGCGEELPLVDAYTLVTALGSVASEKTGTFRVLTRRGATTIHYEEVWRGARELRLRDDDAGARRTLRLEVRRMVLRPAESGGETLLRMRGETTLWLDVHTGALLEISGLHEKIGGRIVLRAKAFSREVRERPRPPWPERDAVNPPRG